MIVRETGAAWQVVLQTDHAELSEEVARAWADVGPRHDSVVLAARRHDDGWATWERSPMVDDAGKPVTFLDVHVPAHLAFYRAGIAAITDEDPYAGLLVSMHGAGIYRQRYGADPSLALTRAPEVQTLVDAFVAEQEAAYPAADGPGRRRRPAPARRLPPAPVVRPLLARVLSARLGRGRRAVRARLVPLRASGAWRTRVVPWPFATADVECSLVRRLVPKRAWTQGEFRDAFSSLPAERVPIAFSE